jgi:hypothetical protein
MRNNTSRQKKTRPMGRHQQSPRQAAGKDSVLALQLNLVHEAPHPILSRLYGLHDRMFGSPEVLRGVFVLGGIAAANMTALPAKPQVHPGVAHFEALFAALAAWPDVFDMA